jgi:hypothetical protein
MPASQPPVPVLAAVLITERWGAAERSWARSWARVNAPVQRIVVDCSPGGLDVEGPLDHIRARGARAGAAANAALSLVKAPWVLVLGAPVDPPRGLFGRLPAEPRVLIGSGEPPDGPARSALDALLLHLLPPDAAARAPSVWPSVPEGIFAVLPTAPLRELGGFDPEESHLVLATQIACLALSAREVPVGPLAGLRMGTPHRSFDELVAAVRDIAAARVVRLQRDPETPLESGWSLAGRGAVARLLQRDPQRAARSHAVAAIADVDMRPLAESREWVPIGQDILRRLMMDLRSLAQTWPLEGLVQGLDAARASSVPGLLSRHPLRLARGPVVVVPVERHEPAALLRVLHAVLRQDTIEGTTVAVVSGPSTGAALRSSLAQHWPVLRFMALLRGGDLLLHPMPLSAARAVRLLAPAAGWVADRSLQSDAWGLHAQVVGCPTIEARSPTPLALPVERVGRLLLQLPPVADTVAWGELGAGVLRPVAAIQPLGLVCLPAQGDSQTAAEAAVVRFLDEDPRAAIHVLPGMVPAAKLARLAAAVHGVVGSMAPALLRTLALPHAAEGAAVVEAWTRAAGGLRRGPWLD